MRVWESESGTCVLDLGFALSVYLCECVCGIWVSGGQGVYKAPK